MHKAIFFSIAAVTILLTFGLAGCDMGTINSGEAIKVSSIEYRGWEDCVEISNGEVRLVVVPSIGRIMHYGFAGGENLLYEDAKFFGKTLSGPGPFEENGEASWATFGGDRIWPSQEDMFVVINGHKRPPDHWIDGLSWEAEVLSDGVRITSQVSDYCGARVSREIRLEPTGTRVVIRQSMEKVKTAMKEELEPVALTIWNISKIQSPSQTLISLNKNSCFENGFFVPVWDDYDNRGVVNCERDGDVGIFRPDAVRNQKMGADAPYWIAGVIGRTVFAEFFTYDAEAVYPDGGTSIAIFTCPDFTELECLSPLRKLDIGEKMEYDIVWELLELPSDVTSEAEKRKQAIQWLQGRG